jgi:hypothetical protein
MGMRSITRGSVINETMCTRPPHAHNGGSASLVLQNKKLIYTLLFRSGAATLLEIAADPKRLGAEIGFFSFLHTWGQNLLHHCGGPMAVIQRLTADQIAWDFFRSNENAASSQLHCHWLVPQNSPGSGPCMTVSFPFISCCGGGYRGGPRIVKQYVTIM